MLLSSLKCNRLPNHLQQEIRLRLTSASSVFNVNRYRSKPKIIQFSNFHQISPKESRSRSTPIFGGTLKQDIVTASYRSRFNFSTSSSNSIFWRMGDRISQEVSGLQDTTAEERPGKIKLTEAEWKAKLTPEEYSVCRNHGTERAWTGALLENKQKGVYTCSCCGVDLFSSSNKFESGSGWPSFYDVMKDKDVSRLPAVDIKQDVSHGMQRTEVLCGKCSSHLGHVFNDGPQPTGLRYCINSVSLKFKAKDGAGSSDGGNNNKNNL